MFSESNTKSSAAKSCIYLDVNEPANSISKLKHTLPILAVFVIQRRRESVPYGSEMFDITSWFEWF